jgi:hypothetical protein
MAIRDRDLAGIGENASTIGLLHRPGVVLVRPSVNGPVHEFYDDVTRPLYELYGRLFAFQGPGLPADGPVTLNLMAMAQTDANGAPVSTTARVALEAHELTHDLQRQLADLSLLPLALARPIGDSTNHLEVVAYIVGETVQYGMLQAELMIPQLPQQDLAAIRRAMETIQDDLATFTGPDAMNANRYLLKSHGGLCYRWNHLTESLIPGNRIPPAGWEQSMRDVGFGDAAIVHIRGIAAQGTAKVVGAGEFGLLGDIRTPTPSPTSTPTTTATQTDTP